MMENIEIKTPREYKIRKIERLNNRYEFFYPFLLRLFYLPMISTLYSVSKHIGNSNAVLVSAVIYFINHIVTNLIVDNKYRAQADLSRLQMEINVEDAKSYEEARDVVQNALDEMNKKIKIVNNNFGDNIIDIKNVDDLVEKSKVIREININNQDVINVINYLNRKDKVLSIYNYYSDEYLDKLLDNAVNIIGSTL